MMMCLLPGAKSLDVSEQLHDIHKGEGEQHKVIVQVDTNNIGRKRNEVMLNEHREIGKRLKSWTSRVVIYGLLAVPHASEGGNRKMGQMNVWLTSRCRGQGSRFLGH